ncbi:MAG: substrate-binding domain-containing protein, partial [Acidobacteriota bacterium]|nr:substrate-binding domain-containing protein [Acidobacteriota bacterium]
MKLITRFALSCLFLLPLASCVQNDQTATQPANQPAAATGTPSPGGAVKRFAFVTNNASDFWTIARRGTEKADTEFADVTVEFKIPADGTAAEQKRVVDDLLAKGVDGIAISPVDPNNQTQMINDVAKQAIVFTQDSDAPQSDRVAYVGTDNVAAGRQAGDLIK